MKTWLKLVIVVLLIISILSIFFIFYLIDNKTSSGLETYSYYDEDKIERFRILYPPGSKIEELGESGIFNTAIDYTQDSAIERWILIDERNTARDRCTNPWGYAYSDVKREQVTINGVEFEKEVWTELNSDSYYYENYKTFGSKSFLCYNFIFSVRTKEPLSSSQLNKEKNEINKIISTLKFIRI